MPAIYFRLGHVQPFADMETERAEEGVTVSAATASSWVCGWTPPNGAGPAQIIEHLGLDADRVWSRLRADADVLLGTRAATWGGGGP